VLDMTEAAEAEAELTTEMVAGPDPGPEAPETDAEAPAVPAPEVALPEPDVPSVPVPLPAPPATTLMFPVVGLGMG
jgi:hypothetical protein